MLFFGRTIWRTTFTLGLTQFFFYCLLVRVIFFKSTCKLCVIIHKNSHKHSFRWKRDMNMLKENDKRRKRHRQLMPNTERGRCLRPMKTITKTKNERMNKRKRNVNANYLNIIIIIILFPITLIEFICRYGATELIRIDNKNSCICFAVCIL